MQGFPEALFVHLLKVMVHPNNETRVGAHKIFVVLLTSNFGIRHETALMRRGFHLEPKNWHADVAAAPKSIATLLDKLRKGNDFFQLDEHVGDGIDVCKEKNAAEEKKQVVAQKTSSSLTRISSIIDKAAGSTGLTLAVRNYVRGCLRPHLHLCILLFPFIVL